MNREMVEHEKAAKKRWEGRGDKECQEYGGLAAKAVTWQIGRASCRERV